MDPERPPYEFVIDPETNDYHFARHGLEMEDVVDVLDAPHLTVRGAEDTYSSYGQTRNGLWVRVIYAERNPPTLRVITAYTVGARALRTLRRRLRKKP